MKQSEIIENLEAQMNAVKVLLTGIDGVQNYILDLNTKGIKHEELRTVYYKLKDTLDTVDEIINPLVEDASGDFFCFRANSILTNQTLKNDKDTNRNPTTPN